jgi:hypothetical protein
LISSVTNFLNNNNRVAPLKTYSKRVNKNFPVPARKKRLEKVFFDQKASVEGAQRRVLPVKDENHSLEGRSEFLCRKQQVGKPASSTTTAAPQRQVLLDINPNHLNTSSLRLPFDQSQKGDSTSPHKTPPRSTQSKLVNKGLRGHSPEKIRTNDLHIANLSPAAPDKDIIQGVKEPSPSKTRRNTHANTPNSSPQARDKRPTLESLTRHLETFPRKRQKPEEFGSDTEPAAKKVKRSSIKSYFKPLPASSSPSTTQSINLSSDNLNAPSSPTTSPLSGGESPKFQSSRKKIRRNLSLKPSLLLPVTMAPPNTQCHVRFSDVVDRVLVDGNLVEIGNVSQDDPDWPSVERGHVGVGPAVCSTEEDASTSMGGFILNEGNSSDCVTARHEIDNGVTHSDPIDIPQQRQAPTHITWHQLRFVTESNPNILCDECGFMFNRTIESEVREHSRWHKDHTRGNHPTKGLLSKPLWEEANEDGFVHRIQVNRRGASAKEREWYENALEISINRGLDGHFTNDLWRDITDPSDSASFAQVPKYKVYVYTIGVQVVTVILAERITKGGAYYIGPKTHDESGELATPDHTELQEYVNLDHSFPVMVSVDRVWTEASHHRKGYATKLLHYVRKDFIPGTKLHRCQVAFSRPTSDGCAFAAKYCSDAFGGTTPFVVDVDDVRMVVENGKLRDKWAIPEDFVRESPSEKELGKKKSGRKEQSEKGPAEKKSGRKERSEKSGGEKAAVTDFSDLFI